jgi:hypothetical protein
MKGRWDYKKCFFVILSVSWITGLSFFILNNFIDIEGEFGLEKHPWQFPILKIHGGVSFLIMVVFGYFLSAHVRKNLYLKNKKGIKSGLLLLSMPILCIITAYALYYISSDSSRQIMSYAHFFIGFLLPFVLLFHIVKMAKSTKRKINNAG